MDKKEIGRNIRREREKAGLTREALAERADICPNYLGEVERGKKVIGLERFIRIINALDVSADYLLRNEIRSAGQHVQDELAEKLKGLSPKQRKTAAEILDAYIRNLERTE